jgi:hypothetical protein
MKLDPLPFRATDWDRIPPTQHAGAQGTATWRTLELGNTRIRMVEYSPGYVSDHWCGRGHILLVLEGELITELDDGRRYHLYPGTSYEVSDGQGAHRSSSPAGAKLFIVD